MLTFSRSFALLCTCPSAHVWWGAVRLGCLWRRVLAICNLLCLHLYLLLVPLARLPRHTVIFFIVPSQSAPVIKIAVVLYLSNIFGDIALPTINNPRCLCIIFTAVAWSMINELLSPRSALPPSWCSSSMTTMHCPLACLRRRGARWWRSTSDIVFDAAVPLDPCRCPMISS